MSTTGGDGKRSLFLYSVKFLCGNQPDDCCGCGPVRPGKYATEINLHNDNLVETELIFGVIPTVLAGAPRGRVPNSSPAVAVDKVILPPLSATMDDCCRIMEVLLGAQPSGSVPITIGFLEILSVVEINVTAVYTVSGHGDGAPSLEIMTVNPKVVKR